jgi:tRNA A-37 threonylcarbamoyl transferase component Bud32
MVPTPGIRWHLAPDWVGPPPRLDEWSSAGLARVVKQAPHRTVWQVQLPGLDVHVKSYREGARRWLCGSRARREFQITREAARRGLPTLNALAWGEDEAGSYLVTRSLPEAVSLLELLQGNLEPCPRCKLLRALGHLLALAYRAGVYHDDLHPGNVLVCRDADAVRLFLIDLGDARLGVPLSWPACRDNLVLLNRWFALRASGTDRFRIWQTCSRDLAVVDVKEGARAVERQTRTSLLRFCDRLDRRCLGGNRHFRRVRSAGLAGLAVTDVDLSALVVAPDGPLGSAAAAVHLLKRSASSAVVEMELAGRSVVYKRHTVTRWTDPLAALFRPPPALRAYIMGHALRLRGLPTPRPLAVWHRRRLGLSAEGYLLLERVPQARELADFVAHLATRPWEEGRRRLLALVEELAGLVRKLHGWNLSHRDLKAANILVSPQAWVHGQRGLREAGPDGADHPWFVDLVGVRKHRRLGRGVRVRNLARLSASFLAVAAVTRTVCLRFLLAYLGGARAEWKSWWNEVAAATRAKVQRNRRLGRPLS